MQESNKSFVDKIVKQGTCFSCGLCVGIDNSGSSFMKYTDNGVFPVITNKEELSKELELSCPGYKLNYPLLYKEYYHRYPKNWLTGIIDKTFIGYSINNKIRRNSSSGGVLTSVISYLIDNNIVDAAIVVKQGIPTADTAQVCIVDSSEELMRTSQSVYIPVSTLDILKELDLDKKYVITCLPEQSAALRKLQTLKNKYALRIKYILGPYTGTAISKQAINYLLRNKKVDRNDKISSLKWRAGEWPGYLEIVMSSGKVIKSKKVYYNYLIPFFVTSGSLQSMDFANEFTDLSVGDAWSPEYEKLGKGFSVVISRNKEMGKILMDMKIENLLFTEEKEESYASSMHGHMIDFKKRGGFIRNRFRKILGLKSPDFGYKPQKLGFSRVFIEFIISMVFLLGRTKLFRLIVVVMPENYIGPIFNAIRLRWKSISKPVKRKNLMDFDIDITN